MQRNQLFSHTVSTRKNTDSELYENKNLNLPEELQLQIAILKSTFDQIQKILHGSHSLNIDPLIELKKFLEQINISQDNLKKINISICAKKQFSDTMIQLNKLLELGLFKKQENIDTFDQLIKKIETIFNKTIDNKKMDAPEKTRDCGCAIA